MLAQAQITPIFAKGHLYSGSHWVRVLRAAELVVSLATGRDPPASAYKLNCLFRKSLQHVYFFKTFCSFWLIGQFQIRFCIIATTYNVERCKKYKCLLKFIVHVFWVLENSNRNVGQWKLLRGLVGGKEGRKDYDGLQRPSLTTVSLQPAHTYLMRGHMCQRFHSNNFIL